MLCFRARGTMPAAGVLLCFAVWPSCVVGSDGNMGRAAYFQYCSACHGPDGSGNGPVARTMRPRPSNLRHLAVRNGGEFPAEHVRAAIDGRTAVAAHGTSKMPVWGQIFSHEASWESPERHTASQVQLIADYLRSIQTK